MLVKLKLRIISLLGLEDLITMLANEVIFEDRKMYIKYLQAQNTLDYTMCDEAIKASTDKTTREDTIKALRGLWRGLGRNMSITDRLIIKINETFPKEK